MVNGNSGLSHFKGPLITTAVSGNANTGLRRISQKMADMQSVTYIYTRTSIVRIYRKPGSKELPLIISR
jgi:hypothetical protein